MSSEFTLDLTTLDALLPALAVVGRADCRLLLAIAALHPSAGDCTPLRMHPAVAEAVVDDGSELVLDPAFAASLLHALEADNFLHFRQLHERALHWLGQRLLAGETRYEASFQVVVVRLAERLINQTPQMLADLIASLRTIPVGRDTQSYLDLFAAIALRNQERYSEAITRLTQLLDEQASAMDVRGRAFNARGVAYFWQGHLQAALDDYQASLQIREVNGNQVQMGLVNLNIGITLYELHDYGRAERHLRQAEALFSATQSFTWLASVQNELGLLFRNQGRWAEALAAFHAAIARRQAEGSTHSEGIALNNIGEVLLLQGKVTEAEAALTAALAKLSSDNVRIDTLLNLGMVRQLQQRLGDAQDFFDQALAVAHRIERNDILPSIHYRLADLARHQGEPAKALTHLSTGIAQIEATRTPLRDEGMKISLLGRWQQLYEAAVLLLVEQQRLDAALTLVERARARTFFEMIGADELPTDEPMTAEQIRQQLPATLALIAYFATGLAGSHDAMIAQLPAASGLRALLLPPERLLVFCVSRDAIHLHTLTTPMSHIESQHFNRGDGRLRGIPPLPGQPLRPLRRWQALGRQLLEPLTAHLAGKAQLCFVPHSTLHYLPLHALTDPDQLTGVPDTTVAYAPSASILLKRLRNGTQPQRADGCLAIGVNADGLAHAEAEAAWIAHLCGGQTLLGTDATQEVVLAHLAQPRVIHFSCHGHFRQRDPMQSALQVSGGELTAATLLATVRLQADLVTLSACDTGLNHLRPGDEPLGLTRAFLGCGARSLLVSLWPVHEIPTRLLMERFYQVWQGGASKAAALRTAQRDLAALDWERLAARLQTYGLTQAASAATLQTFQQMAAGQRPFDHPTYWGAFLLIGDPT